MNRKQWVVTLFLVVLAAVWKLWLLSLDAFPFNSDEAIVGLMSRHILSGANPIFFYGQAYMGSLDAYLVAAAFLIFGQTVNAIRIIQLGLYLGTIITTIAIARSGSGSLKAGWIAALLLAIPAVNTTLYTTVSLGGYGEALLIGNLIILIGIKILKLIVSGELVNWKWFVLLGWLIGLGLWANGLTLIYSLPVSLVVLKRLYSREKWRKLSIYLGIIIAGVLLGSIPWWIYAAQNGLQSLFGELLGSAIAVETQPWITVLWQHILNLGLFGVTALFGFRPPWEVRWLAVPLIPVVMLFWIGIFIIWIRSINHDEITKFLKHMVSGVILCLIGGFLFTPFGVDPSGRYFLPIAILMSLIAGMVLTGMNRNLYKAGLIGIIVIFHGWGTIDCAFTNPPGITTQFSTITRIDHSHQEELIAFLIEKGELRGYTNYWVAYPLAFLSNETILFSPRLPYHSDLGYTARDDRYPLFTRLVEESKSAAFITTHHPVLDQALRENFIQQGVTWSEQLIGDYRVFYNLSAKVSPSEMNLAINPVNDR